MSKVAKGTIVIATLMVGMLGCVQPPLQEINNAKAAIEAARVSEAALYATEQFTGAVACLDSAMIVIRAQERRILREYKPALAQLDKAIATANASKKASAAGKQQMQVETEALIAVVTNALTESAKLMEQAIKAKKDITVPKQTIDESSLILERATSLLLRGQISPARRLAEEARRKSVGLNERIQQAPVVAKNKKAKQSAQ